MNTSNAVSSIKMNDVDLWMKAAGHSFKNFAAKLVENLNELQWMCSGELCDSAEFQTFYDIYCFIKSSNIDVNVFLNNDDCNIVYKYAKDFSLKYNKKKCRKKKNKLCTVNTIIFLNHRS